MDNPYKPSEKQQIQLPLIFEVTTRIPKLESHRRRVTISLDSAAAEQAFEIRDQISHVSMTIIQSQSNGARSRGAARIGKWGWRGD